MGIRTSTKILMSGFAVGGYLLIAYWLKTTYVPDPNGPPSSAGVRVKLFVSDMAPLNEFSATVRDVGGLFEGEGDESDGGQSSPILIYENGTLLGPAHSTLTLIVREGHGRYQHQAGRGYGAWVSWASSDNTSPITNGRGYWVVKPTKPVRRSDPRVQSN